MGNVCLPTKSKITGCEAGIASAFCTKKWNDLLSISETSPCFSQINFNALSLIYFSNVYQPLEEYPADSKLVEFWGFTGLLFSNT